MNVMNKIILTLGLLIPTVLFGQLDRSVRPKPAEAPSINIKDSEVFKTENGITVILSENHKLPKVSFSISMGSSPMAEGDMTGLADFAGSLIMSGTDSRTKDELDAEKDYIGASLSASNSSMYLSCLKKHMDKGLTLMSDVIQNANFPQDEVDRVRAQFESSLSSAKSEAGTMSSNVRSKVNFPGNHPYGEVMTEETLSNITRDAIVDYYNKVFTPEGSYMVVVGDINRKEVEAVIEKYFKSWSGKAPETAEYAFAKPSNGARVIFVNKPGAVQSVISITFPLDIAPGHPDYLKLQALNGILGGGVFGNRLMQNLREDKAYTYGCRSSLSINEYGSYFSAGGNFRNEVTDSSITEILYELERIIKDKVEDDEIKLTKSFMAGSFARSLESPSTVARFARNIIKYNLPKDYYQTYLQQLDAVSKDDLLAMAKKYINVQNCNIIVVGNEEVIDRLKQFDADGKIERMDAFGNPVIERAKADISADELIDRYIKAVAMGCQGKKLAKKFKKLKSYEEVFEYTMDQMPFPMLSTRIWKSPNVEGNKMEGNGMVFQKSYFDGEYGVSTNMQTGLTKMEPAEIEAKNKSVGLFPEMNYKTSGMTYELLGIEEVDGKPCYVLKTNDGQDESFKYYDKSTYLKVQSITITTEGEETRESVITMGDYQEYGGFLFPNTMNINIGPMSLSGTVKTREVNAKVDPESYK
jgi:predicted Zn-dependent peptidase